MFNHHRPAQLYKIRLEELPAYQKLTRCSVFDYIPAWKQQENERQVSEKNTHTRQEDAAPPASQTATQSSAQKTVTEEGRPSPCKPPSYGEQTPYGERSAARPHKAASMPRQMPGTSCIYDFPDMKGTAPDDIGLVEMSRSEIAGEDVPELEELDDDLSRIPPGRGI